MINSSRVAAAGLLCIPALALPLLLAPSAGATIDSFAVGCGTPSVPCQVSITTSGADRLSPVTLSVNGTVVGQGTPYTSSDGLNGFAQITWTPPAVGAYTVTVTQGTSTRSVKVGICPPNPSSYPNLSLSPGSAVASACSLIASSLDSGSTSGSASILLPLFSGSAGM
ncbi:hypothetical protein ACQP1O_18635 [Nocardia sp. CA-151230]|uniref:hypothetical protein n=1 Tax=Nocardia sp. CA-151230 TaxID=3239982 RepID=UPI003D8E59AB